MKHSFAYSAFILRGLEHVKDLIKCRFLFIFFYKDDK